MPHAGRTWPESELHHVTIASNGKSRLFHDALDRELFLDLLDEVVARFEWDLYAWCLLGNHVHLVARAAPDRLARGMQRLKGVYAIRFHRRHHTHGHHFKRPYHSRPITTDEQLHRACRYTMRNAVWHGFVERIDEWEWSSFRTVAGLGPPPRANLHCEQFVRLMDLRSAEDRFALLRAYLHEDPFPAAMISA